MKINKIYYQRNILDVDSLNIRVDDPSKFTIITIPNLTQEESSGLIQELKLGGTLYASDLSIDFVEIIDDYGKPNYYYTLQVPALLCNIKNGDDQIPVYMFPLRGESFHTIFYVRSEEDIDAIEQKFGKGGCVIMSSGGMTVEVLEPITNNLIDEMVRRHYTGL
jgi:hypothetical protein